MDVFPKIRVAKKVKVMETSIEITWIIAPTSELNNITIYPLTDPIKTESMDLTIYLIAICSNQNNAIANADTNVITMEREEPRMP